jgi:hypothetical protein
VTYTIGSADSKARVPSPIRSVDRFKRIVAAPPRPRKRRWILDLLATAQRFRKSSIARHSALHCGAKCDSCRRSLNRVPLAPILQDAVWCKLAAENEVLCAECCFKRAFDRGIDLTRASLKLCALNLAGWPWSYFNLFTTVKQQSSERKLDIYDRYLKAWGARDRNALPSQRRSRRHKSTSQQHREGAL